jgi:hypothetical protein
MKFIVQGKKIYKHHKRYPYNLLWWDLITFNTPTEAYSHINELKAAGLKGKIRIVERVEIIAREEENL